MISDNEFGGWCSCRLSKAALNMMIKNAAIEIGGRHKNAIIVGPHPGIVDTNLPRPFHKNVPMEQLLTPHESATKLLEVLASLTSAQSGKCFA
jgi:NAD(P)-dependent dehydrogenase (short-subunit alcohol dehydrogenase family)